MSIRFYAAALTAAMLVASPALAQTKPAPAAAKPAAAAPAAAEEEAGSGAQKKACDAKWKTEKEKTGAKGWKAYFTFMAKCM
ncbi:hypothetical protein [Methyloraptor flagellatus]|jgi:hypothetical protein|uniref:Uncharacterized protein n=1 Tax=Methyloraptor flagellatus TaxID=3162530 RepID=A0AAU7XCB9_9HYPH